MSVFFYPTVFRGDRSISGSRKALNFDDGALVVADSLRTGFISMP